MSNETILTKLKDIQQSQGATHAAVEELAFRIEALLTRDSGQKTEKKPTSRLPAKINLWFAGAYTEDDVKPLYNKEDIDAIIKDIKNYEKLDLAVQKKKIGDILWKKLSKDQQKKARVIYNTRKADIATSEVKTKKDAEVPDEKKDEGGDE